MSGMMRSQHGSGTSCDGGRDPYKSGVNKGGVLASGNTQISFHGLYKLVQAPKVSKVTSRQARSIFCQVDEILY